MYVLPLSSIFFSDLDILTGAHEEREEEEREKRKRRQERKDGGSGGGNHDGKAGEEREEREEEKAQRIVIVILPRGSLWRSQLSFFSVSASFRSCSFRDVCSIIQAYTSGILLMIHR